MQKLCPSAPLSDDSLLLGIVTEEGRVQILDEPIPLTEQFIQIATKGRAPESRFRFANSCQKGLCINWENGACGLIERVHADLVPLRAKGMSKDVHPCSISDQCRWFDQAGQSACVDCQYVVTKIIW